VKLVAVCPRLPGWAFPGRGFCRSGFAGGEVWPVVANPFLDVRDAPDLAHLEFVVGRGKAGLPDELLDALAGDTKAEANFPGTNVMPGGEALDTNRPTTPLMGRVTEGVRAGGARDVVHGMFGLDDVGLSGRRLSARIEPLQLGLAHVYLVPPWLLAEVRLDPCAAVPHADIQQVACGVEQAVDGRGKEVVVKHGSPRNLQFGGLAITPVFVGAADPSDVFAGVSHLLDDVGLPNPSAGDGLADGFEQFVASGVKGLLGATVCGVCVGELFVRHGQILTDTKVAYICWHEHQTCHATKCRPPCGGIQHSKGRLMSNYGTKFVETEALLAVAVADIETAERLLGDMLPGELARLARDARELAEMCVSMERIKRREAN
jgi:hypothetical protein